MPNRFKLLSILAISYLGFIVYSNTFYCAFHLDDLSSIVDNIAIRNTHNLQSIWHYWPCRFLTYFSFAFNYHWNGLNVAGYHIFNLMVHLASAVLLWWLVLLTLSTPAMKEEKIALHARPIALCAGLIFVAHPIQTEAVTYIVQRAASMAAMFYLLSLCLYIQSRLLQEAGAGRPRLYYMGSLMAAIAAMFTKETAVTLPVMILLYEFSFFKTGRNLKWKYVAPFLFTLLIIPLTMLLTRTVNFHDMGRSGEGAANISSGHYLLTQFRVMVTYLRLLFFPFNQNLDYDYPISKSIFEIPTLASFLLLTAILLSAKRLFAKYRLVSFSIFWFFLTLLPESSFLPIRDVIFEHRLYLPAVGYSIFLVSGIYYLLANRNFKAMAAILAIIIACYAFLTYQRNKVWSDDFSLWNDAVQRFPHKARPYYFRGVGYYFRGNLDQAIADFTKAIEIDPSLEEIYNDRADIYAKQGRFNQAIADYDKAIQIKPHPAIYFDRALAYDHQGRFVRAIADFDRAITMSPNFAKAYYYRSLVYDKIHDEKMALQGYQKAQELCLQDLGRDNHDTSTLFLLIDISIRRKDFIDVRKYAYRILNHENDPASLTNLGTILAQNNVDDAALDSFIKAMRVGPGYKDAYLETGTLFYNLGKYDEAIRIWQSGLNIDPLEQRFKNDIAKAMARLKLKDNGFSK